MAQRYEYEDRRMRSCRSAQDERRSYGGNRGRSREQSFSGSFDRGGSSSRDDDDDDRRGGGRSSGGGRGGWFGDSEGHAEAARRGRSNR